MIIKLLKDLKNVGKKGDELEVDDELGNALACQARAEVVKFDDGNRKEKPQPKGVMKKPVTIPQE